MLWKTYQHGQQPENPPPVRGLRQKPAYNRPDDGSNQHAQTKDTHDEPTLRDGHQIRDGSSAVGQGRATKHTGDESENQEGGRVGRQAAQRREQCEENVSDVIDEVASVDLGQGREEEGADTETDNLPWLAGFILYDQRQVCTYVNGYGEGDDHGRGTGEFIFDLEKRRRHHRRSQGTIPVSIE